MSKILKVFKNKDKDDHTKDGKEKDSKDSKEKDKDKDKKSKEDKRLSKASKRASVAVHDTPPPPPPSPAKPSSPIPVKTPISGYSKNLDLEEGIFKSIVAKSSREGKDELKFYMMVHMVNVDTNSRRRYGFYEQGSGVSLPCYLLFTSKQVHIIDASDFQVVLSLSHASIVEVVVEVADNGLFSFSTQPTPIFFVTSPSQHTKHDILSLFGREAKILQDLASSSPSIHNNSGSGSFTVSHRTAFSQNYIERSNENQIAVKHITETLRDVGIDDHDIWNGKVDLTTWIKNYPHVQGEDNSKDYVIEFTLPSSSKLYYKFTETDTIKHVIQTVSVGAKMPKENIGLAPIHGCEMNEDQTLGSYGLGIFFDMWQLKIVNKGTLHSFLASVSLPSSSPEFQQKKSDAM
eukprot:TRINITY_DN4103_c1_g2_i1.p1 TRINITY_DN4103_c1_g2~~TRINITY_DN4103_c1_g2_i1.p1  ORF type:complete len:404 (-),score=101.61 TRINITY_DN4103_c1_g2_i1:640-1851(-)